MILMLWFGGTSVIRNVAKSLQLFRGDGGVTV